MQHRGRFLMISRLCALEIPCESHCVVCDKIRWKMDPDIASQDPESPASFVFHPIDHVPRHKILFQAWDMKQKYRCHPGHNHERAGWSSRYLRASRRGNQIEERIPRGFQRVSTAARLHGSAPRGCPCPWHRESFATQTL